MKLLAIFAFLLLPFFVRSNTDSLPPDSGLLWSDSSYLQIPVYALGDRGDLAKDHVDLSHWCPAPGDQSGQQACVGFAVANAMSILWATSKPGAGRKREGQHRFSPAFIYNQIKINSDCRSGAYLDQALKLAREQGVCSLKSFPFDSNNCTRQPTARQRKEASRYRIESLQRFPLDAAPDSILRWTKYALSFNNPVVVGLRVTPNFYGVAKGQERWKPFPVGGGSQGHALVVVGYDLREQTVTLFNSHGSEWGKGGFVKMAFDDYARQVRYGVVLF
ncbi:MAG: C1 family peptidase [Saprospiraceae bacterium]